MKNSRQLRIARGNLAVEATVAEDETTSTKRVHCTFLTNDGDAIDLNAFLAESDNLLDDLQDLADLSTEIRTFIDDELDY